MMKLILAILSDIDSEPVSQALIAGGFRVTRVASTGGFLRRGSTTLVIGLRDERVDEAIETMRSSLPPAPESIQHRITLCVIPVESYTQI